MSEAHILSVNPISFPRRSMDRARGYGPRNAGSIPAGGTKTFSTLVGRFGEIRMLDPDTQQVVSAMWSCSHPATLGAIFKRRPARLGSWGWLGNPFSFFIRKHPASRSMEVALRNELDDAMRGQAPPPVTDRGTKRGSDKLLPATR